ncbi:hypothetical protein Bca52824_064896 [Brassica carinata]|uniref:Uncharacterized protein n=1 Tax=Brassica carinata TaxID=52824 RepID=A0A8X7QH84_BRACI|nr:hypothetical protein Bca52824_064896 [Brassica carinata]
MVLHGIVSSPLRRPHALKKQQEDLGSFSTVFWRPRLKQLYRFLVYRGEMITIYIPEQKEVSDSLEVKKDNLALRYPTVPTV